ncbi:thiosulfate/3-mercaptopyruvate sulfurtransferase, partial [Phenoliferia sp. Uapishka_3]
MSSKVSLISPTELSTLLAKKESKTKLLDSTWFMPNLDPPRSAWKEFKEKRIPGAGFFDLDVIASKHELGLAHMLPTGEHFADACSRLGVSRDSHVVLYDTHGLFSAPRTAFTFKAFGHPTVSILDGGLPRWIAEKKPVDTSPPQMPNAHAVAPGEQAQFSPIMSVLLYDSRPAIESYFIADIEENMPEYPAVELDTAFVRSYEEVVENSQKSDGAEVVLDARPKGRFDGTSPEPRPGLSSGHIPNSLSVPFATLLSPPSSTTPPYQILKSASELDKTLTEALGAEEWNKVKSGEKNVVATCGSGMTAGLVWLALQRAGREGAVGVYDESWTGYAQREESKIIK